LRIHQRCVSHCQGGAAVQVGLTFACSSNSGCGAPGVIRGVCQRHAADAIEVGAGLCIHVVTSAISVVSVM
jgi:hypothetical protein